jgi:hypothetical protein
VPLFVLVGLGIGTSGGAVACWRLVKRFLDQLDSGE